MSEAKLNLKLTSDQKAQLSKFLAHQVDQLQITPSTAKNIAYGSPIPPILKPKGSTILALTKDQQKLLKDKFNCSCTYLEVTSSMEIK